MLLCLPREAFASRTYLWSKFGRTAQAVLGGPSAAGLRAERTEEILQCAACDDALRILREEGLYEAALARLLRNVP